MTLLMNDWPGISDLCKKYVGAGFPNARSKITLGLNKRASMAHPRRLEL
ncbi:hypothetical protein At1D1108_48310 (plasmid) [Agrobacterium tumefaciens]|jgi:hypothetical protein|nr:hypothetical protein At1D1108_48310 [Agrobacterium tumefaciens]TWC79087.1 hypothetical protein FB593_10918 [Rhizobium sp. SJZ105]